MVGGGARGLGVRGCGLTRPLGSIRQALSAAAWDLHRQQQAFTWRDLGQAVDIGRSLSAREQVAVVKTTVRNMAAAGELRPVGHVQTEYANRPMVLYEPAVSGLVNAAGQAAAELVQAMRGWVDFK